MRDDALVFATSIFHRKPDAYRRIKYTLFIIIYVYTFWINTSRTISLKRLTEFAGISHPSVYTYNTRYICVSEKKPTDDEGPTYYIILYAVVCGFHRDLSRFKLYYVYYTTIFGNFQYDCFCAECFSDRYEQWKLPIILSVKLLSLSRLLFWNRTRNTCIATRVYRVVTVLKRRPTRHQ